MMEPDIRCEWGIFSLSGSCSGQALWMHSTGAFCDEHSACALIARRDLICRDPRPVAILCGALAGALPPDLRALIAAYVAGDDAAALVALDRTESLSLHLGGYGPERYEEWPEAGEHEHVWLPFVEARPFDSIRRLVRVGGSRRCTCGMFEHERRSALREFSDLGRSGKSAATRRIIDARVAAGETVRLVEPGGTRTFRPDDRDPPLVPYSESPAPVLDDEHGHLDEHDD